MFMANNFAHKKKFQQREDFEKIKLEELKMIDCEKDKAYAKCKCQIQELESQGAILREEVTKLHESLEKGTSVASIMNECPKCTKMLDSQKRLGLLIDT